MLDDEPYFIAAYKDVFELEGYEVSISQNEDEFFKMLNSINPTAVIIDIMLHTGYDAGLDVYGRFRRLYPVVPAILLTNREDMKSISINDPFTKILLKRDITPIDLVDSIRSMLKKESATISKSANKANSAGAKSRAAD